MLFIQNYDSIIVIIKLIKIIDFSGAFKGGFKALTSSMHLLRKGLFSDAVLHSVPPA